jgi:hypothetical protein
MQQAVISLIFTEHQVARPIVVPRAIDVVDLRTLGKMRT